MTQPLVEEPWPVAERRQEAVYGDPGGNRTTPRRL